MADDIALNRVGQVPDPGLAPELASFPDADTFLKKVGPWAFYSFFLSTQNDVSETLGRFAVKPVDGLVIDYLEANVAPSNRLPTGHLYDANLQSLASGAAELLQTPHADVAADVLEGLDRDLQLRDYLSSRRLEYFLS